MTSGNSCTQAVSRVFAPAAREQSLPTPGSYNGTVHATASAMGKMDKRISQWRRAVAACAAAFLVRWHLCSLDAPTVAVVWALLLARTGGVRLQPAALMVLALGTWMVYVLDRVLDGTRAPGPAKERLEARHHFHRRHRRTLLGLCGAGAILLGFLCSRLPARLVEVYLLLGIAVAAYAASVHVRMPGRGAAKLTGGYKESCVALLFTAAVAAPALLAAAPNRRPGVLAAACLLVPLCWLNCAFISHAEAPAGVGAGHRRRRVLTGLAVALALVAAAACGADYLSRGFGYGAAPALAVLLSSVLLLGLLRRGAALVAAPGLRVLADVALLTPVLFVLGQR